MVFHGAELTVFSSPEDPYFFQIQDASQTHPVTFAVVVVEATCFLRAGAPDG